jgi:putative FmdB family regulatory protein
MPFYDYHCDKCGNFEIKRGILEDALTFCPKCGGRVYQIFHPPEIRWTGKLKWIGKGESKIPPALGE